MSHLMRLLGRLCSFFNKRKLDADLDAELEAHLEMAIEEKLERGLTLEEARRMALVNLGGMAQAKEKQREARGLMTLDILLQDLKYTFRTLNRDRSFAVVAILILALGIGSNIAVFSVVNTLLLRPLPFANARELVWIAPPPSKCGFSCETYSADAFEEFRALSRSYQDVTGYFAFSTSDNVNLTGHGEPLPATGIGVIGNFFQVLGVRPAMGRFFFADEARRGARPVVILANPYWRHQFAADPNIVGKSIGLDGQQVTVIGVLPASFDFGAVFSPGAKVDLFMPLILDDARTWGNIVTMIGRLKPGVSLAQARSEANLVAPHLCRNVKDPSSCGAYAGDKNGSMQPRTLKEYVSGRLRRSLIVLWSAVGVILLIACVNLSNLLLARAAARSKEFALRGALGASRGRITRQMLTESLVLSFAGALLGLGLAFVTVTWLAHQGAVALPLLSSLRIDSASLGWTVLVAVFAAILFGTAPAIRIAGGNLYETLKDSGPGAGHGRKHERVRAVLVVSEVALACMLLVGAGLLLRSFIKVLDVDLGFQPHHAFAIKVQYDDSAASEDNRSMKRGTIFQQILRRVDDLPGVEAAGMVDYLPLEQNRSWGPPIPKGRTYRDGELPNPLVYMITPGYLRAMGMRVQGRDFTWDDGPKSQKVILLNQAAARFLWPGENAIGKVVSMSGSDRVVVGIVNDVHQGSVEASPGWQVYFPATQEVPNGAYLVVRTTLPPAALAGSVLHTLRELNPGQPAAEFRLIQSIVNRAVSPRRFFMLLVAAFATLGLLLAALGIYGVISYSVTQRTQEIGIRMALGSSMARVQRQVMAGTMRLALVGIVLGSACSVVVARLIASLLFGTSPWDFVTYLGMALSLLMVAFISGYIPARRASRINPIIALRVD
jgi:predicted permease